MESNILANSTAGDKLDSAIQDFESDSEAFSIDTDCQAGVRDAPVIIENQPQSESSSFDSQLEINDGMEELNIEFKTTSNQYFGKLGKSTQNYFKRPTEIRKLDFLNYITKGEGVGISMPFSLVKNKVQNNTVNIMTEERRLDNLKSKLDYLISPYNKCVMVQGVVEYDSDFLDSDEEEYNNIIKHSKYILQSQKSELETHLEQKFKSRSQRKWK